jgi:hypothetical protein
MKSSTSATFSSLDPGEQHGLSPSIQIENLFKWIFIVGGLPGPFNTYCLTQIAPGIADGGTGFSACNRLALNKPVSQGDGSRGRRAHRHVTNCPGGSRGAIGDPIGPT